MLEFCNDELCPLEVTRKLTRAHIFGSSDEVCLRPLSLGRMFLVNGQVGDDETLIPSLEVDENRSGCGWFRDQERAADERWLVELLPLGPLHILFQFRVGTLFQVGDLEGELETRASMMCSALRRKDGTDVSFPNFLVKVTRSLPAVSCKSQTPCSLKAWRNSGVAGVLSAASFS